MTYIDIDVDTELITKPNLIIAGTVKGGTTSLFTYLSKHPSIGISKVKETCFFLPVRYRKETVKLSEYANFFNVSDKNKPYILEATPGYLEGGRDVAMSIKKVLEEPKIVFVLRNPSARLQSFFHYHKSEINLPKDMKIEEYINLCQSMPFEERKRQENDPFWGVDGGFYIHYLIEWFDVFGKENIKVIFFEDLVSAPKDVMVSLSNWLKVDSNLFEDMNYTVENKTVSYRFKIAHKMALKANQIGEPILRKIPLVKRAVRSIYYFFNSGKTNKIISEETKEEISQFYSESNQQLANFLKLNGYNELPVWLEQANEE